MKSAGFHTDFTGEIRRISKDQLPGMVSPMFMSVYHQSFRDVDMLNAVINVKTVMMD